MAAIGTGCATLDGDQARICRIAVPALEPPGSRITVTEARPADEGVRLVYRAGLSGFPAREHFVLCRFAPGRRDDLVAITTDRGEVAGATVYLLKRYYVDTPEGAAADPGPP